MSKHHLGAFGHHFIIYQCHFSWLEHNKKTGIAKSHGLYTGEHRINKDT